jgi:hypothetical protein
MVLQVAKKTQEVNHDGLRTSFSDNVDEITPSQPEQKSFSNIRAAIRRAITVKNVGIIALAGVIISLLFYMLVGIIFHPSSRAGEVEQKKAVAVVPKKITIRASEDIKVIVRVEEDKSNLFSGTLKKGSEKMLDYTTPIQIYFDRGEFLIIELANGEYLHPDSGRGGIQIK